MTEKQKITGYINIAIENMKNSYSPYSKFQVSSVIVLADGTIIKGVNVENASYGLSMCAERTALFNLVTNGFKKEEAKYMIIVGDTKTPISPCGACRQVMIELLPKDVKIVLANLKGDYLVYSTKELLPYAFDLTEDRQ